MTWKEYIPVFVMLALMAIGIYVLNGCATTSIREAHFWHDRAEAEKYESSDLKIDIHIKNLTVKLRGDKTMFSIKTDAPGLAGCHLVNGWYECDMQIEVPEVDGRAYINPCKIGHEFSHILKKFEPARITEPDEVR